MSTEHEAPEIGGEVVSATPLPSADSTDQLQPSVASISNRGDDGGSDKGDEDVPMTFPQRMMEILSNEKYHDIITWLPHGRGFVILQKKRFANEIMPKFFNKRSKFTSFTRKLNRWNFTRVTRGPETGAYYHPLFQRGDLRLCMQMSCISSKSAQQLQPMNPVALGLTMPLPGQPMVHGMMPMQGGDGGDNFMRLRQLEEQRQNFLLQQQKQQQQIMALAGFGGQGGAPAQVGSTPGFAPQPGMAPAPSSGQQGQPQQQTSGCGQTGQSLQPGQFQQIPNGQPNPMASNPYIAMLMQQGMMNPQQMQQMQMNGGQSASGQTQLPIQIPMQMNPAMQAQFFAFQQNAMMQAQQQQQQLQQPLQGEQQGQQIVQEVQTQLEADGTQEGQQQQQTNSLQQNQQQMQSQIHPTMLQPQMAMGADSQNMILLPQEDQQQQQQQEPLKSEEQTEDGH